MEVDKTGQVQSEELDINDKNPTTRGGPPKWMALAIVGGIFLAVVALGAVLVALFAG